MTQCRTFVETMITDKSEVAGCHASVQVDQMQMLVVISHKATGCRTEILRERKFCMSGHSSEQFYRGDHEDT